MSLTNPLFHEAIQTFWGKRTSQLNKQLAGGRVDTGQRGSVTGGGHMDGFIISCTKKLLEAGIPQEHIFAHKLLSVLPGYYRPTKNWDLIVVDGKQRVKVILELKSITSSYGNNANNRAEEAVGNAKDLWHAFRNGALGSNPEPWVGYLFVLGDSEKANASVETQEPHHKVFDVFRGEGKRKVFQRGKLSNRVSIEGVSYAVRLEEMCRRLVSERLYSSACFIVADKEAFDEENNYFEPADDMRCQNFIDRMIHAAKAP